MDDETRRLVEADLAAVRPFTEIASRHGVGYVDVALVHHRMRPQPVAWPEAVPPELWNAAKAALRREDHRQTWIEMTFDPVPFDIDRAVLELWSAGGTSSRMAAEILDVPPGDLPALAGRLGIPFTRSDA
ncbi:hypothetical protein [Aureimonas endophytica]|nr:hypothetical protein [Aureimonas endophytica]